MNLLGLIGYPLGHSFSEGYFREKFEKENIQGVRYQNFPISSIDKLEDIIDEYPELSGLNVTIPYKEKVIQYLDQLDDTAREVGAVNTIKIFRSGNDIELCGYNTDVTGFTDALKPGLRDDITSALILGTGGASKAIRYALDKLGIETVKVSSSGKPGCLSYKKLNKSVISDHKLIVNTTPLGTYPNVETYPDIPYEYLSPEHLMFDLVYNPEETVFLRNSKARGAVIQNGYEMLIGQAEASWKIWTCD